MNTSVLKHGKKIAIMTLFAGSPALAQQLDLDINLEVGVDTVPGSPATPPGVRDEPYACSLFTSLAGHKNAPVGSMVYFDVTVASWPIELHTIGQNVTTSFGTPYHFDVYITPDTFVGKWSDPTKWTLRASGDGESRGTGILSYARLTSTITLDADTSYGMGIFITGAGHRYHNGNGTNEFFKNDDLSIRMGAVTFGAFGPSAFHPRVWNGTIEYLSPVCACPCSCNFFPSALTVCDIFDFLAFQSAFVNGETCACDFDISTGTGVCDIFDFLAFQNGFIAGCP